FFFVQAEDGIRDKLVTGVQTCALPIFDSTIGAGSAGTAMTFNTGNGYAIYKVLIALDQPGRGKGDLLAGNPPVNKAAGGIAWPSQALEPVYCWNNTVNGSPVTVSSTHPTL